jgi:hypothetical protein
MKRIMLLATVATLMVVMLVMSAAPVFAHGPGDSNRVTSRRRRNAHDYQSRRRHEPPSQSEHRRS